MFDDEWISNRDRRGIASLLPIRMTEPTIGRILAGDREQARASYEAFSRIPVDLDLWGEVFPEPPRFSNTIETPVEVAGPGTFLGKATRTLRFEPCNTPGWWFDRTDLPDDLPVKVSIRNVWNTGQVVSNIVLRSGAPANYIRLVEHIIALKVGTGIHSLMIKTESGDPPLLTRYGREILETLDGAGIRPLRLPVSYVTVKEPVTFCGSRGEFLSILPHAGGPPVLSIDCAVDFKTAIGKQRIRFHVDDQNFRHGSEARTNTSMFKMVYCKTIGKFFADIRNLGYNWHNVLVASRFGYLNRPKLIHDGKSLEAVWHRATLDLCSALALIEDGRFVGRVVSYKAGHRLDVEMVRMLYRSHLLAPVKPAET